MPLTPAQKQAAYRARQRAAKAAAALPTPDQIKTRDEADETMTQLSRTAGVPRNYPLSVWRRAAEHFIQGPGRTQDKVRALRQLCAGDPDQRKAVKEWVRQDQNEASRKYVQAMGWTIADGTVPEALIDRMVRAIETGNRLEAFTKEELESPGDPAFTEFLAEMDRRAEAPVVHGCDYCGFKNGPATRRVGTVHYCDKCPPTSPRPAQPPPDPQSPAAYINTDFGKSDALINAQRALADANRSYDGTGCWSCRANYGPMKGWPLTGKGQ